MLKIIIFFKKRPQYQTLLVMSSTCVKFSALLLIVLTWVHLPQCLIVSVCRFISPLCVSIFNHFLIISRPLLQLTPVNQLVLDWTKVGWSTSFEEHNRDESIEIITRSQYLGQTFLKGENNDLFLFLHCMSFFSYLLCGVSPPSADLCRPGWRPVRRLHKITPQLKSVSKGNQKNTLISLCTATNMQKEKSHSIFFPIQSSV